MGKNADFLSLFFDHSLHSDFLSPFLPSDKAQDYCPCSAYEGTWELSEPYTIPLPLKKPGLFYNARSSNVKMKCFRSVNDNQKGYSLIGVEVMTHYLWFDTRSEALSVRYFNTESKTFTKEFYDLDFENNPSFVKIATVKSLMLNFFEIKDGNIVRTGEPSGRYVSDIDTEMANHYEIDVKDVLENNVGDMIITNCNTSVNQYCDPNTLKEMESIISFDCKFNIQNDNLGLTGGYPYTKGFLFTDQNYSNSLLCECEDS